jgi:ABC-2 type transport system permease protein
MIAAYAAAGWAIFRRDLRVHFSYRAAALTQMFSMVFSLALFYYMSRLLRISTFDSADAYYAFVVVGLVILSVTQSTLVLPMVIRGELVAGTFERMLMSPFGPVLSVLSMMIFPVLQALVLAIWTLGIAALIFGLDVQWATAPLAIPIGVAAALAFSGIALLIASIVVVFKQAPGTGFVIAAITLVSGFYFPTELLPMWLEWASHVQPFTPAVDLMRHVLVDLPMKDEWWVYATRLLAFSAVLVPLSAFLFGKAVGIAQRRGTIIEY